jgi:hypothetical protein
LYLQQVNTEFGFFFLHSSSSHFLFVCFKKAKLMTYLFRYLPDQKIQDHLHSLKDHGWRTYVPGLAYQHIVTTFVVPMCKRVEESPHLDVGAILGTHGFPPWSLEEFHDVIGSQYECF